MDGPQFDRLARSLAGTGSRRGFVGGLLALGAGLAGITPAGAACPPGQVSLRGRCVCKKTGRPPVDGACPCPKGLSDAGDGQGCVGCHRDGDCPTGDACVPSACVAGACARTKTVCDDGQGLCTTKACDPALGCVYTPIDCADGNVCTLDACDPATGCHHPPALDGPTASCDGVCCDRQCQECCTNADCTLPETCGGGGGVAGTCGCTALTYDQACGTACSGSVSDGCGGSHVCSCSSSCPVIELAAPTCFWMNCSGLYPGGCCWDLSGSTVGSRAECQELDSCSPGGGSGGAGGTLGACYKWATTSDWEDVPPW